MLPSGDCGDYPENMPTDWKSFLIDLAVWGGFILVLFGPLGVEFVKSQIEKDKQEKAIKQAKQEKMQKLLMFWVPSQKKWLDV